MTPTHVFGFGAREYAEAHGWAGATIVEGASLNPTKGADGRTPQTARRILITPGEYEGIQGYLGKRAYVAVEGASEERPLIKGGSIVGDFAQDFEVAGLELENCAISLAHSHGPNGEMRVLGIYQHSWTKERNGIVNPHGLAAKGWTNIVRGSVFDGVGGVGNTTHTMYVEGRPGSTLIVEDNEFRGARACSIVKSTCNDVQIRRNRFHTHSALTPWTAHTMVDFPACSSGVISDNEFDCWGDQSRPVGQKGLFTPPIFIRKRQDSYGSDTPPYPNDSWDPPVSTLKTSGALPDGWPETAETFVSEAFWQAGLGMGANNPNNPYLFPIFVSGNRFRQLPGSRVLPTLRNDGTNPCRPTYQFGPMEILRAPLSWFERSLVLWGPNILEGEWRVPQLDLSQYASSIQEGALWPRTKPEHFPRVENVALQLPEWFRQ